MKRIQTMKTATGRLLSITLALFLLAGLFPAITVSAALSDMGTRYAKQYVPQDVSVQLASSRAKAAGENARERGASMAVVHLLNPGSISLEGLEATVGAADPSPVKIHADSLKPDGYGSTVDVRLTLYPKNSTKGMNLNASTTSAQAANTRARFAKKDGNLLAVVSLAQEGDFGQTISVATMVNLNGIDLENLHFYTYDRGTKQYSEIQQPKARVDLKGYLYCSTSRGGDIIITNGVL